MRAQLTWDVVLYASPAIPMVRERVGTEFDQSALFQAAQGATHATDHPIVVSWAGENAVPHCSQILQR